MSAYEKMILNSIFRNFEMMTEQQRLFLVTAAENIVKENKRKEQ